MTSIEVVVIGVQKNIKQNDHPRIDEQWVLENHDIKTIWNLLVSNKYDFLLQLFHHQPFLNDPATWQWKDTRDTEAPLFLGLFSSTITHVHVQ